MVTTLTIESFFMKLSFAQWFKLRRDIVGVTQAQIASSLGVRPQTVSNWEKGVSNPSLDPQQTYQLCSILKISLDELAKGFRGDISVGD